MINLEYFSRVTIFESANFIIVMDILLNLI